MSTSEETIRCLLAAGYDKDIIDSFKQQYRQYAYNANHPSIIQHFKQKYHWNQTEIDRFYAQMHKTTNMNGNTQPNNGDHKHFPLLLLQSTTSCDSNCNTETLSFFIDDNSISATFPSIPYTGNRHKLCPHSTNVSLSDVAEDGQQRETTLTQSEISIDDKLDSKQEMEDIIWSQEEQSGFVYIENLKQQILNSHMDSEYNDIVQEIMDKSITRTVKQQQHKENISKQVKSEQIVQEIIYKMINEATKDTANSDFIPSNSVRSTQSDNDNKAGNPLIVSYCPGRARPDAFNQICCVPTESAQCFVNEDEMEQQLESEQIVHDILDKMINEAIKDRNDGDMKETEEININSLHQDVQTADYLDVDGVHSFGAPVQIHDFDAMESDLECTSNDDDDDDEEEVKFHLALDNKYKLIVKKEIIPSPRKKKGNKLKNEWKAIKPEQIVHDIIDKMVNEAMKETDGVNPNLLHQEVEWREYLDVGGVHGFGPSVQIHDVDAMESDMEYTSNDDDDDDDDADDEHEEEIKFHLTVDDKYKIIVKKEVTVTPIIRDNKSENECDEIVENMKDLNVEMIESKEEEIKSKEDENKEKDDEFDMNEMKEPKSSEIIANDVENENESKDIEEEPDKFEMNEIILSEQEKRLFVDINPKKQKMKKSKKKKTKMSSFFVHANSQKEFEKELNKEVDDKKDEENEELMIDPFAIYREFPENVSDSIQIERISYLLQQYQSLNDAKISKNEILLKSQCIYQFILDGNVYNKYNEISLLNDWYYILMHCCDDNILFDELYKYITLQIGDKPCDFNQCQFIKRHYQQNITSSDDSYFYGFTENEEKIRIRLMDKIHCHLYHSYDVGFKLTKIDRDYVQNENENDHIIIDKKEIGLVDKKIIKLRRKLRDKIKNLTNIIGQRRRINNKFVTQIFEGININNNRNSQLLMAPEINTHSKRPTKIDINDNYQFGQKFYYWEYHKKAGWRWYIRPRYKDLKTEMISNGLLNIEQWNILNIESRNILSTFLSKSYIPFIEKYFGNFFYGIRDGDKLSHGHILSVLLFCNDYNLQIKLNKTYNKRSSSECNKSLKQRHSYYANWARLLCETVEVFSNNDFYLNADNFYHGTNVTMNFNEIYASLYAPTSMTRSFEVAICYSNKNGLLLHFQHNGNMHDTVTNNRYFECNWISPWSNQSEILFVGAAAPLKFKSVIQCKLSYNYINYISAINIIQCMLNGNPLKEEIMNESILNSIHNLIHHQLQKEKINYKLFKRESYAMIGRYSSSVIIDDYIYQSFNYFIKNYAPYHIQFDLYLINTDYNQIKHFFFNKNGDWIKFDLLFKLFINIKYLTILPGWNQTNFLLKLTENRIYSLLNSLKNIDKFINLQRISIHEPNTKQLSLKNVIKEFKNKFKNIGWNILCQGYKKYDTSDPQLIFVKI